MGQLLTLDQVATKLQCDKRTVRRQISDGKLPAIRFGERIIRIDSDELDKATRPVLP